jgi:hypothetical protein
MDRAEFEKEAQKTLKHLDEKVNELEIKRDDLKGVFKPLYEEKLIHLKGQAQDLQKKYDAVLKSNPENLEKVQETFSSATMDINRKMGEMRDLIGSEQE